MLINAIMSSQRHTAAGLMFQTFRPHNGQSRPIGPNRGSLSGKHAGEPRGKKCQPQRRNRTPQDCEHADSTKRMRERNGNSGSKRKKAAGKVAELPDRGFRVTRTFGDKPGQGIGRGEGRERMPLSNQGDEAENTQEGFTKTRQNP